MSAAEEQALDVRVGQQLAAGTTIAGLGNTGRSTGPHLHFEVRFKGVAQNPARFLAAADNPILAAADPDKLVSPAASADTKSGSSGRRVRVHIR